MSSEFSEKNYSSKMDKSIQSLRKDISTLRTGRANTNMLDTIKVDVYGQLMPINQIATVSVPEARLISIQVWDKGNTSLVESALQKSVAFDVFDCFKPFRTVLGCFEPFGGFFGLFCTVCEPKF